MKVISLNTWHGKRQEELSIFLKEQEAKADIFCFQEADLILEELADEILKDFQKISGTKPSSEEGFNFENKTYVRRGIDIIASGTLLDGIEGAGIAFWSELESQGEKIFLVNVHGESRPGNKLDTKERIYQSQAIIDFLENKSGTRVVVGDFNLFPETKSIVLFTENGYRNLIKEYEVDTTRNEMAWAAHPENRQLWADYVFVSKDVPVKDFEVPKNQVSDHLPLILEFDL